MIKKMKEETGLIASVLAVLIAMVGGVSNFLMDEDHSFFRFVVSIITSGFAGFLVFLLSKEYGLSDNLTSVACGISGLAGESILKIVRKFTLKKVEDKLNNCND